MSGADLFNTASVSYRDPAGVLRSAMSNAVVVTVFSTPPPTDPIGVADPDLSGLDGKTFSVRDTISLDYHGNASAFNWEFNWLGNRTPAPPHARAASGGSPSVFPVSTPAPRLSLASLALPTGRYLIRLQGVNGSSVSAWASATITLVSTDLSTARVFPNPWRAARGDTVVHFEALAAGCTIKIFTVSGRLVQTMDASGGFASWNLTNDAGDKVASGLYLYLITDSQGDKTRGKLAIIR